MNFYKYNVYIKLYVYTGLPYKHFDSVYIYTIVSCWIFVEWLNEFCTEILWLYIKEWNEFVN